MKINEQQIRSLQERILKEQRSDATQLKLAHSQAAHQSLGGGSRQTVCAKEVTIRLPPKNSRLKESISVPHVPSASSTESAHSLNLSGYRPPSNDRCNSTRVQDCERASSKAASEFRRSESGGWGSSKEAVAAQSVSTARERRVRQEYASKRVLSAIQQMQRQICKLYSVL